MSQIPSLLYDDLAPSPLVPIGMGRSSLRWCKSESDLLNKIRYDAGFILQKSPPRLGRRHRLLDRYLQEKGLTSMNRSYGGSEPSSTARLEENVATSIRRGPQRSMETEPSASER